MASGIFTSTERSLRSVFVGNIPYDATEEKLKDIFSEVGPVLSFRLVYDRETGKPKGYGFCEYKDQETAMSAMRNLSGYELNGRTLRVDNAANERAREEMRNLQMSLGGSFESPYGPEIEPDKAPEAISKAVASLPPEQMFELAKQMKQCIQTNPNEARNMLLQNPQLSYALLQALVVMRVVEPQVAMSILYRQQPVPTLVSQEPPPQPNASQFIDPRDQFGLAQRAGILGIGPGMPGLPNVSQAQFDSRVIDPRIRDAAFDRFGSGGQGPVPTSSNVDPRTARTGPVDPRLAQQDPRLGQQQQDPRSRDPRNNSGRVNPGLSQMTSANLAAAAGGQWGSSGAANQDQEKAQLIMQVLALTDQQIAMLPAEQRQSIMLLKEQISRGNAQ